jgi:hypothetical protein
VRKHQPTRPAATEDQLGEWSRLWIDIGGEG